MALKKIDYNTAVNELEEILRQLEANELGVDELTTKAKRATELIKYCKEQLYKTDEAVKSILNDNQNETA